MGTGHDADDPGPLRSRYDGSLRSRVAANPGPAVRWSLVAAALLALQVGALVEFLALFAADAVRALPVGTRGEMVRAFGTWAGDLPTLLSRETIPNRGHYDGQGYVGTFLGLSPMLAWLVRVTLVYAYAFALVGWTWVGYRRYRRHYRVASWTPRDDVVDRFRDHYWGLFGLVVVFMFVVMAVFAPALGPTTVERNIDNPYGPSSDLQYWDAADGEVRTTLAGEANRQSRSVGSENVGPMTYDDFGRFHPFGTLPSGKDLFTFLAAGSRISLLVGLCSVLLSSSVAVVLALTSAYYKGAVDLGFVLLSDAVMALPQLLLVIMLTVVLADTWLGNLYSGAAVLGLIFAATGWPYLWRAVRGPSLQVAEREWVDAARGFGQRPRTIMRKHMLPYVLGYLLVYGSMTIGGAIIAIAGLSFLGLGVNPGTPEWGQAINAGQDYVDTASWHVSLIPGALITLVVTGFNALGDGIRDAIDPQSDSADATGESAGRGGGV